MVPVRDILLLQKRELEARLGEKYVEKDAKIKESGNLIRVITGPRRAGKSFFAIHHLSKLGKFGYANFDDEKLVEVEDYDEIINAIDSIYDGPKNVLFDEIQNLKKWELFVNRLQRQGYRLVITGSNSNLLSRELATHLTGRHTLTQIFPFSFREFIKLDGRELTEIETREKLVRYLTYGGYPEPLVKGLDHREYLSTLLGSVIYKDIVKRFRIRSPQAIEDLALYLISNAAKEFSYNTLSKVTRCRSAHTVEKYLRYLEETFILFRLGRFSFKVKEQIASKKKIYCIDNGFFQSSASVSSKDTGRLYENAVAIELKRREAGGTKTYYWKNEQQEEVDFVVKQGIKVRQLIQVCCKPEGGTEKREIRALLKASKDLGCRYLLVITEKTEKSAQMEWFGIKRAVRFVPLWKWLLS